MPDDQTKSPSPPSWATSDPQDPSNQPSQDNSKTIFNNSTVPVQPETPQVPSETLVPPTTPQDSSDPNLTSNPSEPIETPSQVPPIDMSNLNTVGLSDDSPENPQKSAFNPQESLSDKFNQMDEQEPQDDKPQAPPPPQQSGNVPPPNFSQNQNEPKQSLQPPDSTQGMATNFKKNQKLKIIIPLILVAIIAIVFVIIKVVLPNFTKSNNNSSGQNSNSQSSSDTPTKQEEEKITLTYWGLWEDEAVLQDVFADFEAQNSHISINYIVKDKTDYRETLQEAISSGIGPDIFRIHNTWLPMFKTYLQPDSSGSINMSEYFPTVKNDLTIAGQTFAVAGFVDGLALFYNEDMLSSAAVSVPKTWDEVKTISKKLTIAEDNKIKIAGIALGDSISVDNFSDILALMIKQDGGDPSKPSSETAKVAIQFYTTFASTNKVWDKTLGGSTYAFANEKVAMIIAPSWRTYEIMELNPTLNFKTAPVPQLSDSQANWSSYWAEAVSAKSKNTDEAWKLLAFMNQDENLQKIYNAQVDLRGMGEVYAKKDLAQSLYGDGLLGSFAKGASTAQTWYMCSNTHDSGINDRIIKYYEDAVTKILENDKEIDDALETAEKGIDQVLVNYN